MSARNIHALIYGQTGSGVTTLIMRWVSGRLPTSMEELALPYNGVKNINIRLAGQKTSEVVMVTLVDGGVFRGDEKSLRRVCGKVDVIVACTCVQVDDTDLPDIQHINKLLGARRPPVIVLGTMSDLRDEASDKLPLFTAIACSDDVEEPQDVLEEMGKGSRDAPSSGYPELAEEPRRVGHHRHGKKPDPDQTPFVTSELSIDVEVFEEQTPLMLVSTRHGRQDQSIERNSTKEQDVAEGETHSLMPGQFQVAVSIENPDLQKIDIGGSKTLELGAPETNGKVHFSGKESFPIMTESHNEETSVILNESSLSSKLELTIENLKRHSIKNDDPEPEICSIGDDCSAVQEKLLLSDGEASDVTGSDRRMASPTDLEFDNIEHDLSFLSRELMNISTHRMNPHYWSTESINGSVGSYLDRSRDEINVPGPAHNRPLRQKEHADDLSPRSTQPLHQLDRSSSSHKDVKGDEVNHSSETNTSPIKPLLETHFPVSSDSSFTVKYFPSTQNSNAMISNRIETSISSSTDCSQTSLHNNNACTDNTGKSGKCDGCIANGAESTSTISALHHGEVSTSSSSSLPEVKNLHISLDLAPVKLIDPYPGKALLRGVNSGGFLGMEDGTRCVKNLRVERYMECSALTGDNLHQVFEYVVSVGCKYNRRRNAKCLIS